MSRRRVLLSVLGVLVAGTAATTWWYYRPPGASIESRVETDPVPSSKDAADDTATWVDPTDPTKSRIVGTDKRGGLHVYDITGKQVQDFENVAQNNVDLRSGIPFRDGTATIVVSTANKLEKILFYRLNESTGLLDRLIESTQRVGIDAGGLTLYRSKKSGKVFFFVTGDDDVADEDGFVEQWEFGYDPTVDRLTCSLARRFDVGEHVEGCAADDELGYFYVSEEQIGVWRYSAEPDGGTERELVERIGWRGRLRYNAEGIAIYEQPGGKGYLVLSSQGSNDFVVCDRQPPHVYRGRFRLSDGNGIDAVTHTDGIDIASAPLGSNFPSGVFIAQDDTNDGGNQNFKLASWRDIVEALKLP